MMRLAGILLAASLVRGAVIAQVPNYAVHPDFAVEHFTVEDGLPVNAVSDVLQTRDGYLWLATFDGLVRFDGHRFVVFTSTDTPGLESNRGRRRVACARRGRRGEPLAG